MIINLSATISSRCKPSEAADEDLAKMFQEREDRLKRHHNDEIKEWEDRVAKLQGEKVND